MGGSFWSWLGQGHWPGSQASPLPAPTGGTPCIPPLWCVCSRRRWLALSGGLRLLVRVGLLLPPGSVDKRALDSPACTGSTACWGQKKQNQEEEERLHAMLPSPLSHMRLQVSPGRSLKSLRQRQLSSLPSTEPLCHHPTPAPSTAQAGLLPEPGASSSCLASALPQGAQGSLLQHQERVPCLAVLALDGSL